MQGTQNGQGPLITDDPSEVLIFDRPVAVSENSAEIVSPPANGYASVISFRLSLTCRHYVCRPPNETIRYRIYYTRRLLKIRGAVDGVGCSLQENGNDVHIASRKMRIYRIYRRCIVRNECQKFWNFWFSQRFSIAPIVFGVYKLN